MQFRYVFCWGLFFSLSDAIVIEHPGGAGCHLGAAKLCDVKKGLFFRGAGALPFGVQVASVRALLERLLTPGVPLGTPVAL